MRILLTVLALCAGSQMLSAQGTPVGSDESYQQKIALLQAQKAAFESKIKIYQDSLKVVEMAIYNAQPTPTSDEITKRYYALNEALGEGYVFKTPNPVNLKQEPLPSRSTNLIAFIPKKGKIKILGMVAYPNYKVEYNGQIGYIASEDLILKGTEIYELDNALKTTLNWSSSSNYAPSTSGGYSGDKTIHTGPRGGRYHYSASGKKVYEKKH